MCCFADVLTILITIITSHNTFFNKVLFHFIYIKTKPKKDSFSFHLHSPLKIRERREDMTIGFMEVLLVKAKGLQETDVFGIKNLPF
jgi:hypothetical protein